MLFPGMHTELYGEFYTDRDTGRNSHQSKSRKWNSGPSAVWDRRRGQAAGPAGAGRGRLPWGTSDWTSTLHRLLGSRWAPLSSQLPPEVLLINYEVLGDRATQWAQNIEHWLSFLVIFIYGKTIDLTEIFLDRHHKWLTSPGQPSGFTRLVLKVSGHSAPPNGPSQHEHPHYGPH